MTIFHILTVASFYLERTLTESHSITIFKHTGISFTSLGMGKKVDRKPSAKLAQGIEKIPIVLDMGLNNPEVSSRCFIFFTFKKEHNCAHNYIKI